MSGEQLEIPQIERLLAHKGWLGGADAVRVLHERFQTARPDSRIDAHPRAFLEWLVAHDQLDPGQVLELRAAVDSTTTTTSSSSDPLASAAAATMTALGESGVHDEIDRARAAARRQVVRGQAESAPTTRPSGRRPDDEDADRAFSTARARFDATPRDQTATSGLTPRAGDPLIGMTLGGCVIEAWIGSGGMGTVYRAQHLGLDKLVAVKVMSRAMSANPVRVERFKREARAAARIEHPGIVQVLNVGEQDNRHFIVMQYIEGEDLRLRLRRRGPFDPRTLLDVAGQCARGLAVAHAAGIIHRDIKPDNIMFDADGRIRITDFGLAKALDTAASPHITSVGKAVGTPYYMSPEQCAGRELDARSDIYSLGATLYHVATGKRPFRGESPLQTALMHIREPLVPPRELRPDLPRPVDRLIRHMMAKHAARRYADCAAVVAAIEEIERELDTASQLDYVHELATRRRNDDSSSASQPLAPASDGRAGGARVGSRRVSQRGLSVRHGTDDLPDPGASTIASPGRVSQRAAPAVLPVVAPAGPALATSPSPRSGGGRVLLGLGLVALVLGSLVVLRVVGDRAAVLPPPPPPDDGEDGALLGGREPGTDRGDEPEPLGPPTEAESHARAAEARYVEVLATAEDHRTRGNYALARQALRGFLDQYGDTAVASRARRLDGTVKDDQRAALEHEITAVRAVVRDDLILGRFATALQRVDALAAREAELRAFGLDGELTDLRTAVQQATARLSRAVIDNVIRQTAPNAPGLAPGDAPPLHAGRGVLLAARARSIASERPAFDTAIQQLDRSLREAGATFSDAVERALDRRVADAEALAALLARLDGTLGTPAGLDAAIAELARGWPGGVRAPTPSPANAARGGGGGPDLPTWMPFAGHPAAHAASLELGRVRAIYHDLMAHLANRVSTQLDLPSAASLADWPTELPARESGWRLLEVDVTAGGSPRIRVRALANRTELWVALGEVPVDALIGWLPEAYVAEAAGAIARLRLTRGALPADAPVPAQEASRFSQSARSSLLARYRSIVPAAQALRAAWRTSVAVRPPADRDVGEASGDPDEATADVHAISELAEVALADDPFAVDARLALAIRALGEVPRERFREDGRLAVVDGASGADRQAVRTARRQLEQIAPADRTAAHVLHAWTAVALATDDPSLRTSATNGVRQWLRVAGAVDEGSGALHRGWYARMRLRQAQLDLAAAPRVPGQADTRRDARALAALDAGALVEVAGDLRRVTDGQGLPTRVTANLRVALGLDPTLVDAYRLLARGR